MPLGLEAGFMKGSSQNLPVVTAESIVAYIQSSENHVSAELKNRKLER